MTVFGLFRQWLFHRRLLLTCLALGLVASDLAAKPTPGGRRPIVIGVVGDQTYSPDLARSYAVLAQGVGLLARRHPDVVLHTGDLVESTASPEEVRARFAEAAGILDRLPVPWYLTAGDHDVSPPEFVAGSSDRSRERLFQELYGERRPAFNQHLYYSFDVGGVGGVHFVALYSHQTLCADPRWGDVFLARLHDDQLAWLAADLAAHRRARAIVVFLHQPLWYHWSSWQKVHALLRRYRVALVLAGHFHYAQDEGEIDGIRYLTVGATGGDTKTGSRAAGNVQEVALLRVEGPQRVRVELLPVDGGEPPRLTPREDMDRVQALDVQLGNLWDFAPRNPVFVKGGQLTTACENGQPAKVRLANLGNPIDLPLALRVDLRAEPSGVALGQTSFASGLCAPGSGGATCVLPPAARIDLANDSSVQVASACPTAGGQPGACPPLWEAALLPAGPTPPAAGTVLAFTVRSAFAGASGELFLERIVKTTIGVCP